MELRDDNLAVSHPICILIHFVHKIGPEAVQAATTSIPNSPGLWYPRLKGEQVLPGFICSLQSDAGS